MTKPGTVVIHGKDGRQEEHSMSDVLLILLNRRRHDVAALEEVMRVLGSLPNKYQMLRVLAFAKDWVEEMQP